MRSDEHKVARAYVLYREERRREREAALQANVPEDLSATLHVTLVDGSRVPLDVARLSKVVHEACADLPCVDANLILKETLRNLYEGIRLPEVATASVLAARPLIETEPHYSQVAARLL